jgi:hypothetical protein
VTYPPPHQQYYGQPAQGDGIALTLKYFPLAFLLAFFKPVVRVDGQPFQVPWNQRTVIPVMPGQHHLHVHTPYLLPSEVGKADLGVNVGGGQPIEVEYRAPLFMFSPGSLGAPPQKYNGVLPTVLLIVVPLAIVFLCCCGSFLLSLNGN